MSNQNLWKYCGKEEIKEYLLSLNLLDKTRYDDKGYLACLYALSNHPERHYHRSVIPKKDGTERILMIPDPLLKGVQRRLLRHLLWGFQASPYATAYQKGSTLKGNVVPHQKKTTLVKLDICDFFSSIDFSMVYRLVFHGGLFPPAVGVLLTHLCCYEERLPQGAPTSPVISNLVMKPFDTYMGDWCEKRGIAYTRYADDMTFSGDFAPEIVIKKAKGFLAASGFTLNRRKTRIIRKNRRQTVTGIVVNEKPQVSRAYRRRLRQEIYYCRKFGIESHMRHTQKTEKDRYLCGLLGRIGFVLQINPKDREFLEARQWLKEERRKKGSCDELQRDM